MPGNPEGGSAPAVFFDRDGTLMVDVDYCSDPKKVFIHPGVREALQRLKKAGYKNIVITNQSGIGRGYMTEAQYRAVEEEVRRQIGADVLDATYFCPDAPGQPSTRRKPLPGMVFEAADEHGIDLARSFFVGDKGSDIECGRRAGVRTIFALLGSREEPGEPRPDFVAKDVVEAVDIILQNADV
ncbi:MAG TPA: HAD family hydrolase [Chthoniobacteraceae bacterium]|nr:HAD family hydrolase [Chthoniobacteraceae bacterium]